MSKHRIMGNMGTFQLLLMEYTNRVTLAYWQRTPAVSQLGMRNELIVHGLTKVINQFSFLDCTNVTAYTAVVLFAEPPFS